LSDSWRRCFTQPVEECFDDAVDPVHGVGAIGFRFLQMDQMVPMRVAAAPANSAT
jgi:hypothetical protein